LGVVAVLGAGGLGAVLGAEALLGAFEAAGEPPRAG
jgi:hypothetical protein